jgi:hypothetical protein
LVFLHALISDLVSVPAAGIITPIIPYAQLDIKLCDIKR